MISQQAPISLIRACVALTEYWSPRVVGRINNQYIKVVKVQGEFPWHTHDQEDEMFSFSGPAANRSIRRRRGPIFVAPGEFFVVPRGIRHNTSAAEETWIALTETTTTLHSGTEQTPLTRSLA